jgi:hypothetical protein
MFKLCAKDFRACRWWWLLVLVVFILNISLNAAHNFLFMIATLALALGCLVLTLVQEFISKTEVLYGSLPLTRRTIVGGRYLLAAFLAVGAVVVTSTYVLFLKSVVRLEPMSLGLGRLLSVEGLAGFALVAAFLVTFYLPLFHRFGLAKSAVVFSLTVTALAAGLFGLARLPVLKKVIDRLPARPGSAGDPGLAIVSAIGQAREALGTPVFLVLSVVIIALLTAVSVRLSIRYYERVDL